MVLLLPVVAEKKAKGAEKGGSGENCFPNKKKKQRCTPGETVAKKKALEGSTKKGGALNLRLSEDRVDAKATEMLRNCGSEKNTGGSLV